MSGHVSPIVFSKRDDGLVEVTMLMSASGFDYLWKLAEKTDLPVETVIGRSLVLFKAASEAALEGKAVGVAADPKVLDLEFTGL